MDTKICYILVILLVIPFAIADRSIRILKPKFNYKFDVAVDISVDSYQGDVAENAPEVSVRAGVSMDHVASPDLWSISLSSIKIEGDGKKTEILAKSDPLFVQYNKDGRKVAQLYRKDHSKDGFYSNLMKSIANLLATDDQSGLLGSCSVESEEIDGQIISTRTNCESDRDLNKRSNHPLGIVANVQRQTSYKLNSDKEVELITSQDVIDYYLAGNQETKSKVASTLKLKFVSTKEAKTSKDVPINEFTKNLIGTENQLFKFPRCDESHCSKLSDFVEFRKDDFEKSKIGTDKLALTTLSTVLNIQPPSAKDVEKILTSKKIKSIRGQIVDILAALQTWETYSGVMASLFDKEDSVDDLERYLQTLSVGSNPQRPIIEDILKRLTKGKLKNEKVKSTLIQSVTSMVYNYARTDNFDMDVIDSVDTFLWEQFLRCKEIECSSQYLRGYLNLKLMNRIPDLLLVVQKQSKVLGTIAMKALQHFTFDAFSTKSQQILKSIFHQTVRKYDSSIRTLALDVLLKAKLTVDDVTDLLQALKPIDKSFEVKQYLLEQFKLRAGECEEFRKIISEALNRDQDLNNYHRIATGGLTTALSRQFLSYPSFNSSIISVQEIQKGVLKRGFVDFSFNTEEEKFSYFTLEIYARGLSSMMGGGDKEEEGDAEEETLTAGMELIVNGQSLRPLQFFSGQGELMGHVWSGTASDPTPAYQATTLFFDHRFEVPLQSGLVVQFDLMTAISIDLNGQVSLSLWNRNGNSKVVQSIGLATVGRTTIITDFSRSISEYRLLQNPKLNLISDFEFSGNNLLCLQLSQPEITLKKTYWKKNIIPALKVSDEKEKNLSFNIPGNSHLLNAKNNEMCRSIHNEL